MRRMKILGAVLLGTVALAAAVGTTVNACWRSRQCCVQYVYIEREVPGSQNNGGGGPAPTTHKVRALVILDDLTGETPFDNAVDKDGNEISRLLDELDNTHILASRETIRGDQANRDIILNKIRNTPVGPKDVFFVYYNGHGSTESDDPVKKTFFNLNQGPKLYREEVIEAMKSKGARLTVLITDTCTARAEKVQDEPRVSKLKGKASRQVDPGNISDTLQKLLLEQQGVVDINSSSPEPRAKAEQGERAFSDMFTPEFAKTAKDWKLFAPLTWELFFEEVKKNTADRYKKAVDDGEEDLAAQGTQTVFSFGNLKDVRPYQPNQEEQSKESETEAAMMVAAAREPIAPAVIRVKVPPDAKLFVDGTPTQQTSALRSFETPELKAGSKLPYKLRVELRVDASVAEVTRDIVVTAGEETLVDLSDPELYRSAAVSATTALVGAKTADKESQPGGQ